VSPLLVPVWALGWWRLARDPALATWRAFAPASALLVVVFMATGGKPYYVAGLYPVLLAAGGEPVAAWTRRSVGRARVFVAALALALVNNALIVLPVLPVTAIAVSNALNPDLGETVGWPKFAETVAGVRAGLPDARVAVLARNYGEAGAVDRYLPALRPAHSGHNAYWDLGPPPADATAVIVVGYRAEQLQAWFGRVEQAAVVDNGVGLDNDEQGAPVWVARDPRAPWPELWPQLRRLG